MRLNLIAVSHLAKKKEKKKKEENLELEEQTVSLNIFTPESYLVP